MVEITAERRRGIAGGRAPLSISRRGALVGAGAAAALLVIARGKPASAEGVCLPYSDDMGGGTNRTTAAPLVTAFENNDIRTLARLAKGTSSTAFESIVDHSGKKTPWSLRGNIAMATEDGTKCRGLSWSDAMTEAGAGMLERGVYSAELAKVFDTKIGKLSLVAYVRASSTADITVLKPGSNGFSQISLDDFFRLVPQTAVAAIAKALGPLPPGYERYQELVVSLR